MTSMRHMSTYDLQSFLLIIIHKYTFKANNSSPSIIFSIRDDKIKSSVVNSEERL